MRDAKAAEEAGAFCVLIECVPPDLARQATQAIRVPTIGIGAGNGCDGQVLVTNDMLGWNSGYVPKFVRQYADLRKASAEAVAKFMQDVQSGDFPGPTESF